MGVAATGVGAGAGEAVAAGVDVAAAGVVCGKDTVPCGRAKACAESPAVPKRTHRVSAIDRMRKENGFFITPFSIMGLASNCKTKRGIAARQVGLRPKRHCMPLWCAQLVHRV